MNRDTRFRRPKVKVRRPVLACPRVEPLEGRNLLSGVPMMSGALDMVLSGQGRFGPLNPGAFFNPPSPIGTDPYSSAAHVNTDTRGDGGAEAAPHNETTIAVNPTNPLNMIGSANDYRAI